MKTRLVLGGPGSGKTERLLRVVEAALARGVAPDRIAFCSFTNAAVDEARSRAQGKFGIAADRLPFFRTLHSLAFRELGLRREEVLATEHLAELAELTGELAVELAVAGDEPSAAAGRGADPLLTLDHYARNARVDLRTAWERHGGKVEWWRLRRFVEAYAAYRGDRYLLDFTDFLERYAATGYPVPVEVAVVDEAQDLTPLQWAVVDRAFAGAAELWVGGDDDQAIHTWAGAAGERLLDLDAAVEVLPRSHRLPRAVFDLAASVIRRVERRRPKDWGPADRTGTVEWVGRPEELELGTATWLLLGRTRRQLTELVATARQQGVVYALKGASSVDPEHARAIVAYEAARAGRPLDATDAALVLRHADVPARPLDPDAAYGWGDLFPDRAPDALWHDALTRIPLARREYYLAARRRGESLTRPPRVRIDTIHGAKGAEAERVGLLTDLTARVRGGFALEPDAEHRVFYVGATRASEALFPIAARHRGGYPL